MKDSKAKEKLWHPDYHTKATEKIIKKFLKNKKKERGIQGGYAIQNYPYWFASGCIQEAITQYRDDCIAEMEKEGKGNLLYNTYQKCIQILKDQHKKLK